MREVFCPCCKVLDVNVPDLVVYCGGRRGHEGVDHGLDALF